MNALLCEDGTQLGQEDDTFILLEQQVSTETFSGGYFDLDTYAHKRRQLIRAEIEEEDNPKPVVVNRQPAPVALPPQIDLTEKRRRMALLLLLS